MVCVSARLVELLSSTSDSRGCRGKVSHHCPHVYSSIIQLTLCRAEGGAIKTSPTQGWDDNRNAVYFGSKASFAARTPTRTLPTATASPTPTPEPKKKKNIGAIVGGVCGGVAALLIIAVLVWFCMRRRRKNKMNTAAVAGPPPDMTPVSPSMTPYEMGEKYSVTASASAPSTSRIGSPTASSHLHTDPNQRSSVQSSPGPMQQSGYPYSQPALGYQAMQYQPDTVQPAQPYHHPAHHRPTMVPYYPPPEAHRPEATRIQSHEMPTVRSPEVREVYHPQPTRPDGTTG